MDKDATSVLNRELQADELGAVTGGTVNETINNALVKVGDAISAGLTFGAVLGATGNADLAATCASMSHKPR
jgi:hypothetical protein